MVIYETVLLQHSAVCCHASKSAKFIFIIFFLLANFGCELFFKSQNTFIVMKLVPHVENLNDSVSDSSVESANIMINNV